MNAPSNPFSLAALIQTLRLNAIRRPLWKENSAADFLDLDHEQVRQRIEDGRFPYAFNIGLGKRCGEARILALSIVEERFGPHPTIGATRNLKLDDVINLVLPNRPNIRSTELKRFLSCSSCQVHNLKKYFRITRKPSAADGPKSFTVFRRASVAGWLAQRRMT
jgi:hypothetical protein